MHKPLTVRDATASDLNTVILLDQYSSKEEKPAYWGSVFDRYSGDKKGRHFLVAEISDVVVGFIIGEVRAWEFGSPPCGWVFALAVSPDLREKGIGQRMFAEISKRLKQEGVTAVRTMVERDNKLLLSFFRNMGLCAGRYTELEKRLA